VKELSTVPVFVRNGAVLVASSVSVKIVERSSVKLTRCSVVITSRSILNVVEI
jgi:hypothetical protein